MKTIVFAHPNFLDSTSMPLFAKQIADGLRKHGDSVEIWQPKALIRRLPCPNIFKKWLGYIDQYLVFPLTACLRAYFLPADTLFIFSDQALGPWVPIFAKRPHVIHCHDLLALRSSLGEFSQNHLSLTGRLYQAWIRRGFGRGRRFICVSHRSKEELLRFLPTDSTATVDVVHNGLNYPFSPMDPNYAIEVLSGTGSQIPISGFLLHVGGNQWYKNRAGVIAIYAAYVMRHHSPLPLVMIGAAPNAAMLDAKKQIPSHGCVEFVVRPSVEVLHAAYSLASALIFPSVAEGFGWPIIEAMACGCPVLTTDDAPMTEAGGNAATYLPLSHGNQRDWAIKCASILANLLARSPSERERVRSAGLSHAAGFSEDQTIDRYLKIYSRIIVEATA